MERILQKRYRIVRALGRGGLGAVYLCDDLRLPGKQWALKVMHSPEEGMYEKFRETFEREASTLSRLRHPNLPVMVDFFEEGEDCCLVMEYIEGENLAEHVRRRGPLNEREAFQKGLTLVELLGYLHAQNPPVIFRDLKPENVMLTTEGILKLVDFGLARRFVAGKRSDTVPSGSVGYAAPEQWEDLSQTDERSDIYSWGATMAYLVTGKIPSPVFPLSALRTMETPLTETGSDILMRCLRGRPAERYADVGAVAEEVRTHLGFLAQEALSGRAPVRAQEARGGGVAVLERPVPVESGPSESEERRRRPSPAPSPLDSGFPGRRGPSAMSIILRRMEFPFRSLAAPLALLLLATLAFLGAVFAELPRGTPKPVKPSGTAGGVGPYKLHYASNPHKDQGKRFYELNDYARAVELLDQATTKFPDDAQAQILKENAYILLTGAAHVRIPYIGSMTGIDGADAFSQLHGLSLAQTTINQRGGINGKRLLLDLYDDHSSTATSLQIAERLARDPRLLVVMGPYNTQRTTAVAPVFNNAKVPLLSPSASGMSVWDSGPYVFSAADSTDRRVRALARWVVQSGYRRVGLIGDEGQILSREMISTLEDEVRHGGPDRTPLTGMGPPIALIGLPPFQASTLQFQPQIEAIEREKPDIIFFCDYRGETTAAFARQLRAAGLSVPIFSQTIPFSQDLVSIGGEAVDGLVLSAYFHPQINTPRMRGFMATFRRRFGDLTPTHLTVTGYDATMALADALEKTSTREGLRAWLSAAGNTRPPLGGVAGQWAPGKRLDARPVWIVQVRDGLYRLLEGQLQPAAARGN
ncbi:MAG: hypothetical protein FJX76_15550 [Armatimonadetes bacterium]|nr:hypothetical protein [Armatimonadota bacterium]